MYRNYMVKKPNDSLLKAILKKTGAEESQIGDLTKPPDLSKDYKTSFKKTSYYKADDYTQIDLLFLPADTSFEKRDIKSKKWVSTKKYNKKLKKNVASKYVGYQYLLVAVDVGSRRTGAEPLLSKEPAEVLTALKKIYKSKYLKLPKAVMMDAGTEFADVKKWLKGKKIGYRVAETNRHRQQAVVESMNKTIGRGITQLLTNNELISGKLETNWIQFLPDILDAVNSNLSLNPKAPPLGNKKYEDENYDVLCGVKNDNSECEIYDVGTKVRIALDAPKDIEGKRQMGGFRSGDLRWSLKPYVIENVLIFPRQPIRYKVKGRDRNTFSKGQLKLFSEKTPRKVGKLQERDQEVVPEGQFIVEKFVDFKKEKNKKMWRVKWEGYSSSENTWESEKQLKKDMTDFAKVKKVFEDDRKRGSV